MHIAALNLDSIACVQDLYGDDRRIWNGLFELFSKDLAEATSAGIDLGYQRGKFFPIVLGNKGDWSYLAPQTMHGLTFWQIYFSGQCIVAYIDVHVSCYYRRMR